MGLPLRLQSLLDRCEPGFPLWDLCCDHGLLGLEALASEHFTQVIFNDAVPHVLELLAPRLADRTDAKMVLSLAEEIAEPLTGNIILAGVGGEKIFKILTAHAQAGRLKARRVIVCPEKHADWLREQVIPGLTLVEHITIPHNHHTRQILFYKVETESVSEAVVEPVGLADSTTRFSNRVTDYVKYRPSYPAPLLDFMFSELGLSRKSIIADVGSGTGIFSQLLLERGARVYAVEPNAEMRSAAQNALGKYANFTSIAQSAEQTGILSSSVDMVCAATAFHWFDAALAKTEWTRILKPGGIAFMVWNIRREDSPFLSDYEKMLHRFGTGYSAAKHRNTRDNSEIATLFYPHHPRMVSYPNEQKLDFESLVGRLLSSSYTPVKGHPNHTPMMKELEKIFAQHQNNGKIKFEYDSKAYFGKL